MRRGAFVILAVAMVVALAAAVSGQWLYDLYLRDGPQAMAVTVVVPKGATVAEIAQELQDTGVVSSALMFRLAARATATRITGVNATLQAGEYRFDPGCGIPAMLAKMRAGDVVVRRVTVPEGLTSRQVVALLDEAPGLEGRIVALPVEGAVLPETYNYTWGDDRAALLRRMTSAMTGTLDELWDRRAPGLPLPTPRDALILASIVEKETALPDERPRVAAVFLNRLRDGMRLQADPTVAYAVRGSGGGPLSLADLRFPSPYNTYVIEGLPPGPIANPGRASIEAVLHPAGSDDLYFVADGSGGHVFARTLDEHQRNVARWRRLSDTVGMP